MATHDMEMAAFADRTLTLRDGALGQDLTHATAETPPALDDQGRIQLPAAVARSPGRRRADRVEIRPEGVLLRPEMDSDERYRPRSCRIFLPHRNGSAHKRRLWPFRRDGRGDSLTPKSLSKEWRGD